MDLVWPEEEGFWLEGDEAFLSIIGDIQTVWRKFGGNPHGTE